MLKISESLVIGYDLSCDDYAVLTVAKRDNINTTFINVYTDLEAKELYKKLTFKKEEHMDRSFKLGDKIICSESGVIGVARKFYIPTASEEQTLVATCDGRLYHAPTRMWRLCSTGIGASSSKDQTGYLNPHEEYTVKFAETHDLSIQEANEHPMIKAHLEVMNALQDEMFKSLPNIMLREG